MADLTIRDELVEKAARAAFNEGLMRHAPNHVSRWDDERDQVRESWRVVASAALTAVADDIRAEALRDAADWLAQMDDGRTGGYREAGRHIIARLRDRADRIGGCHE